MDDEERTSRGQQATDYLGELQDAGVVAVALTFVDNSGITRVKGVPVAKLPSAAAWGVGMSPVFDGFRLDDMIVAGTYAGSPVGDLRLHPDLARLTVLAGQPGWAWAPVDRYDQEGSAHPQCSRLLAARLVEELADRGLTAKMAFEVEWAVSVGDGNDFVPGCQGPAYGMARVSELSDYAVDTLAALATQGVSVDQFHPEYAAGQLEISVAAQSPVDAADTFVLVRETIRAISLRHGLRASFSPKVLADGVGNGAHVHLSLWSADENVMAGGNREFGLSPTGAAFSAGILDRLPALLAVGAPSVASYLRLIPSHWAGAFACWGLENREAALRFITGPAGNRNSSANLEVKCLDATANPYLVVAGLLAAGMAGMSEEARLPAPVPTDPASLSSEERAAAGISALPTSLEEAVAAFEKEPALRAAFGDELSTTIAEIRRFEQVLFADSSAEEIATLTRWKH
ncbi:MAG: glutamine synthetase family protein [Actinomycetota bacterium]|nr:glutamine synthetase family protein [Actinomycetota bacterium]